MSEKKWGFLVIYLTGIKNKENEFEEDVILKANNNIEEINKLREDVEESVNEFNKYFPNKTNDFNRYEEYSVVSSVAIDKVIESEEKLQKSGKYVGMDEKTRIKAVLAEGQSTESAEYLSIESKMYGQEVSEEMLKAYKTSKYQTYMNDKTENADGHNFMNGFFDDELTFENLVKGFLGTDQIIIDGIQSEIYKNSDLQADLEQVECEKYIALILANDKANRQNNGTYLTKSEEEWQTIDNITEEQLRNLPKSILISRGEHLQKKLEKRYNEITEEKSNTNGLIWNEGVYESILFEKNLPQKENNER